MNIIEGKPVLAPGVCFLCEMSPQVRYVDTLYDFFGIIRDRLDGRKYVCEGCVESLAKEFGYSTDAQTRELKDKIKVQTEFIGELRQELEDYKSVKEALDRLNKPAPKPRVTAKAA